MTLRVGLIGYGLGGATFHAPLVHATPGLALAAIVVRDPGRRAQAAQGYPDARLLAGVDELWDASLALDLVVVSSPSGLHAPHVLAALANGRHVVVDKPFATSPAEARLLAEAARAAGRLAIPFQNRRWDGDFLTLRRLVAENRVGRVFRFESRFERWRERPKPRWCEPGAREAGEGIVHDIGSHLVDQALVLFGPARRVYAQLSRVQPEARVEQDAVIALDHASGVHTTLVLSAVAAASGARFTLFGERGAYVKHGLDGQEAALKAGGDPTAAGWGEESPDVWGTLIDGERRESIRTLPGAYARFYAQVRDAIDTGAAPPVSVHDAIATAEVLAAAFTSADEGRAVSIG